MIFTPALQALRAVLDGADPALRVYLLRPDRIEPPAVYIRRISTTTDLPSTATIRDLIRAEVTVAVPYTDQDEDDDRLLTYFDAVVAAVDASFGVPNAGWQYAHRVGAEGPHADTFDTVIVRTMTCPVLLRVENIC